MWESLMVHDDLEGYVPDEARTALVLVDVINALEFEDAETLLEPALAMAEHIADLKTACRQYGIPAIYANDNFGRWQSNFDQLVERFLADDMRGAPLIRRLEPEDDDYRLLKPKHSGFYAAPMDLLLHHLGVENIILTGLTTDRCVAFTAHDAYMRDYRLFIPRDCSAALEQRHHEMALDTLARVVKADTRPWRQLNLAALQGGSP